MKTFKITYKRENESIDTETVKAKSNKLSKSINDYFFNINSEIITIKEIKNGTV